MPHNPQSDMSIDKELNANFPFNRIGQLYRLAIARGWTEDKFADKLQRLLARYTAPQQGKQVDKTADKLTARIAAVSPVVDIVAEPTAQQAYRLSQAEIDQLGETYDDPCPARYVPVDDPVDFAE